VAGSPLTAPDGAPRLTWRARPEPLPAAAVTAPPARTAALAAATLRRLEAGAQLQAAVAADRLLVLGDDLPWCDGAVYLGWDAGLLLPATEAPDFPPDRNLPLELVAASLRSRVPADHSLVVLVSGTVLASPRPRRRADPAVLARLARSAR
jgi:hypothetical protein